MNILKTLLLAALAFCCSYCTQEDLPEPITSELPQTIIPASFKMVYSTSFEEVRVNKTNVNELAWNFPNWLEYAAMHREDGGKGNGLGGARVIVDSKLAHAGTKSLGLELFNIEKSRRSELIIFPQDYLGKAYYVSYWLYLPKDFGLYDPKIDWDWFEIGNLYNSGGQPYAAIYISNPDSKQQYFTVALGLRDQKGKQSTAGEKRILLTKGRWFEVLYYVKRDKIDGAIQLWFDGQLIATKSGFPTMHTTDSRFTISPAKIYHERGDKTPHKIWIDDLKLYSLPK